MTHRPPIWGPFIWKNMNSKFFDFKALLSEFDERDTLIALAKSKHASDSLLLALSETDDLTVLSNLLTNKNISHDTLLVVKEKMAR